LFRAAPPTADFDLGVVQERPGGLVLLTFDVETKARVCGVERNELRKFLADVLQDIRFARDELLRLGRLLLLRRGWKAKRNEAGNQERS
jgi:hypothetical protein